MDNGYNTEATYRFADEVTKQLGLNLKIYLPLRSRAHREAVEGPTPALDDPRHAAFTAEVKLEPFARALRETAHRRSGSRPCAPPTPPCAHRWTPSASTPTA
jgi:phosphoadenosine phosphosulfate reductase